MKTIMDLRQNGACEIPNDLLSGSFFRVRVIKVKDNIRTEANTILITKEVINMACKGKGNKSGSKSGSKKCKSSCKGK